MHAKKPSNEIRRLIAAFGHSAEGIRAAWSHPAFRIELIAALILTPLALMLDKSPVERALLVACLMLVLLTELLNTGIEAAIDRISTEWHALSKFAKDVGSAAVLISLINAAIVWAVILLG